MSSTILTRGRTRGECALRARSRTLRVAPVRNLPSRTRRQMRCEPWHARGLGASRSRRLFARSTRSAGRERCPRGFNSTRSRRLRGSSILRGSCRTRAHADRARAALWVGGRAVMATAQVRFGPLRASSRARVAAEHPGPVSSLQSRATPSTVVRLLRGAFWLRVASRPSLARDGRGRARARHAQRRVLGASAATGHGAERGDERLQRCTTRVLRGGSRCASEAATRSKRDGLDVAVQPVPRHAARRVAIDRG